MFRPIGLGKLSISSLKCDIKVRHTQLAVELMSTATLLCGFRNEFFRSSLTFVKKKLGSQYFYLSLACFE
jgi:hypothetical protein